MLAPKSAAMQTKAKTILYPMKMVVYQWEATTDREEREPLIGKNREKDNFNKG